MKSLTVKICIVAIGAMLISNVFVARIALKNSIEILKSQMIESLEESVHAASEAMLASNEKEYKMLETLASLSAIRSTEVSLLEKAHIIYDAMILDKDYVDVTILDSEGKAWINNGEKMISFAEREYFYVPYQTGKRFYKEPFINKVTSTMAVFYSVPVFDSNNKVINVIFCVIDGFKPSTIASSHKAGNNRSASIISLDTGLTIASENHDIVAAENLFEISASSGSKSFQEAYSLLAEGGKHTAEYSLNGEDYICAFEKIPDTNWMVVNTVPFKDFEDDIKIVRNRIIVSVAIFTIVAIVIVALVITFSINPLNKLNSAITEIASGNADLTKRIALSSNDEIGSVVRGFNTFTEKLQDIIIGIHKSKDSLETIGNDLDVNAQETASSINQVITNIHNMQNQIMAQGETVEETASAITQISKNIESLERLIENQSSGVVEASSAVEEMIGNIKSVDVSVEKMVDAFAVLYKNSESGLKKQEIVTERIKQIEDQSEMLLEANLVISNIAEQTNLLAMNAAIEAAHAGTAGKGFSVVADEIRKLSETSTGQSKKISEQLNSILQSISGVSTASVESSNSFIKVSDLIHQIDEIVQQIESAMTEQTAGSKQIHEALHNMNDTTSEVLQAGTEMAVGSRSVLTEIRNLQDATNSMKNGVVEMNIGAEKIHSSGASLAEISKKAKLSIGEIGRQVDQFKV